MSEAPLLRRLLSLDGRIALVTGAAGGIGSSVARLFIEAGARVVSVDLPGRSGVEGAIQLPCDLADSDQISALFSSYGDRFERLDILVHCAGITQDAVLWKMPSEAWSRVLRINLDSAFFLLKQSIPLMRRAGGGAIVLVSSINGERGKFGQANYAASKAGLIGLARTAARELGKFAIRVNVIAPGLVATPMTESLPEEVKAAALAESALGKTGAPEDVARAALFLATEMSSHITGQVLRVDGGQLIA